VSIEQKQAIQQIGRKKLAICKVPIFGREAAPMASAIAGHNKLAYLPPKMDPQRSKSASLVKSAAQNSSQKARLSRNGAQIRGPLQAFEP
jgi:hypothetical protein